MFPVCTLHGNVTLGKRSIQFCYCQIESTVDYIGIPISLYATIEFVQKDGIVSFTVNFESNNNTSVYQIINFCGLILVLLPFCLPEYSTEISINLIPVAIAIHKSVIRDPCP